MSSSLDWKDSLDNPVFLPGKLHGQRSLVSYSPQGHKELDVTEQSRTHTQTHTHTHTSNEKEGNTVKGIIRMEGNRGKQKKVLCLGVGKDVIIKTQAITIKENNI